MEGSWEILADFTTSAVGRDVVAVDVGDRVGVLSLTRRVGEACAGKDGGDWD